MNISNKNLGFTLIECLVALLIIAVVLASSTRAIRLSIGDAHDSYVREVALWAADNAVNKFYIQNTYPNVGVTQQNVTMANIDLIVTTNVMSTPNQYFRRIIVSVAQADHPKDIVLTNISFKSQY